MRKKIYTLTVLLFVNLIVFAQAPNWQWAKNAGGSNYDIGISIAMDSNGNSYVTGMFVSPTISFGNVTLTNAYSTGSRYLYCKI